MVDWEYVDRRRAEGWRWTRIARDPASRFRATPGAGSAGRQLHALDRGRATRPVPESPRWLLPEDEPRWPLARIGWLVFPAFGIWALAAYLLASPVGVYFPAIPVLGLFAAVAGFVWAFGLRRAPRKWTPVFRRTALIGVVAGLSVSLAFGGVAAIQGCPVLLPFTAAEPAGWQKAPFATWEAGGAPVLFFYGSVACPFCAASSWAVLVALQYFGNVSGVHYDRSSTNDVDPATPAVVVPDLVLQSSAVSLDLREALDDQTIAAPSLGSCTERAYVSAYDPLGAVPYVVVGGEFVHASTLADPGALQGLSQSQIVSELAARSGTAWNAIGPGANELAAALVVANGGGPASVATNPAIAPLLAGFR